MKKAIPIFLSVLMVLVLVGCSSKKEDSSNLTSWDCSVLYQKSSDEDQITCSDCKVSSKTGALTVQNRNGFEIQIHLLDADGQEEISVSIPAGGCWSFLKASDRAYTVGVHAEVKENTLIRIAVYDGEKSEPYVL